ncbi:MAG: flagellar biosynthesis protein FlhB [Phycisphaerae bacterium]|nr:flagellar biosynthesis protein FlhB [Phycisphaerae bacterium]
MAEDMGQRTELPTERKRAQAREKGQVARSPDLAAAIDLVGAALLVWFLGSSLVSGLKLMLQRSLAGEGPGAPLDVRSAGEAFAWSMLQGLWVAGPVIVIMWVVACAAQFLQVGWMLTLQPLAPKLDRLNPVAGFGRLFSRRSLVKTVVNIVKLVVVVWVVVLATRGRLDELAALPTASAASAFERIYLIVMEVAAYVLAVMLLIGLCDWFYQRWQHTQDLKMSKQEVKDERKSGEGDPEVKARRMRIARELALQRIRRDVPKADVIVTNPTHYAVALRYDAATMAAPKVVAKGVDWLALRIREVGVAHGVPIVEKPPLARALYAGVEEGRTISPEFYQAVAELLAYVYRIQGRAA